MSSSPRVDPTFVALLLLHLRALTTCYPKLLITPTLMTYPRRRCGRAPSAVGSATGVLAAGASKVTRMDASTGTMTAWEM